MHKYICARELRCACTCTYTCTYMHEVHVDSYYSYQSLPISNDPTEIEAHSIAEEKCSIHVPEKQLSITLETMEWPQTLQV